MLHWQGIGFIEEIEFNEDLVEASKGTTNNLNTNALKQTMVTIDQTYSKYVHWPAANS